MADFTKDYQVSYGDDGSSCTIRFRCFDTPNSITLYDVDTSGFEPEDALLLLRKTCLEHHALWSFSIPGSDIARLNAEVERATVDMRTARLIEAMKDFNVLEPAFDFTIGRASYLWKHAEHLPSAEQVAEAVSHVGVEKVSVEGDEVVKADPLVQIDVGGAAKGFVADEIVASLRDAGVVRADIDLGGNLFLMGDHPQGRPWRVAVRVPEGLEAEQPVLELVDLSAVTSGNYERYVEIDGRRYQHIIDARTGWPCDTDIVSATVVSESSLQADLLATTACIVGSTGIDELAQRHPDCRFIAITAEGKVIDSAADE